MALVPGPFGTLLNLQTALDALRRSDWLQSSPSAGGSYPSLNVFRKGDDFALVAEVPGISPSDLEIQVKGRTVRLSGSKAVKLPGESQRSPPRTCGGAFRPLDHVADRGRPGPRHR
jgi:HSP20 family protein